MSPFKKNLSLYYLATVATLLCGCKAVGRQPVAIKKSSSDATSSSTSNNTSLNTSLNQYTTSPSTSSYTSVNTNSNAIADSISIECAGSTSTQLSVALNMRSVWPFVVRPLSQSGGGRITNIAPSMQLRSLFFDGDTVVFTPTSQFELNGSLTVTAQDSNGRIITKTFIWSSPQMMNNPGGFGY